MRNLRWLALLTALVLVLASLPAAAAPPAPRPQPQRVDVSGLDGADVVGAPRLADPNAFVRVVLELQDKPLVDAAKDAEDAGLSFTSADARSHLKKLEDDQQGIEREVQKRGGSVLARYRRVYNGMSIRIRAGQLPSILSLPGIAGAHAVHEVRPDNETSVPFIGTAQVWQMVKDGVPVTGRGVRVAVIDTGIDYTHADFGGPGTAAAYQAIDPSALTPGAFPTAKVVDGWDFAGSNYDASSSDPNAQVPHPDPNPIDESGHGTHVAGTIAGLGVKNPDGSWKVGPGVAPDALLYAYKVFGKEGSSDLVAEAIERAVDPNQDGDLSDHVDVINMSLGSDFGSPDDPSAVAAEKAARAGVIVVASAGNAGNTPYIVGSPSVASGVLSVASSLDNGIEFSAVKVNSPDSLAGLKEAVEGAITVPLAQSGPVTGDLVDAGLAATPAEVPDAVAGRIALVKRGSVTFATKILNAQAKGAIAVVVYNNASGAPIAMGGSAAGITIPGVMVGLADGTAMKAALDAGQTVNVTLSAANVIAHPELADTLSTFTSRGPSRAGSAFKPEIAAPGQDIRSAKMGSGDGAVLMSGTSMAAPHISGVSALMRQLHPDWSVAEIKASLMNSAVTARNTDGSPYPLSLQGAGRVQADAAARLSSLAMPAALGFGYLPVAAASQTVSRTFTVENKSSQAKTFAVDWSFLRAADAGHGVTVSVPSRVTVRPGGKTSVTVRLTVNPTQLQTPNAGSAYDRGLNEYDGYITLTEGGGDTLRVAFQALPAPASDTEVDPKQAGFGKGNLTQTLRFKNRGASDSLISFYNLAGESRRDRSIGADQDLQYAGVRAVPGTGNSVLEFVAKTYGPWATLQTHEFDFYVDTTGDGQPDYVVFNGDLGLLTGAADPNNREVSAVYDLATGKAYLEYYVGNSGASYHTSVASLYVDAADIGLSDSNSTLRVVDVWVGGREFMDELVPTAPALNLAKPAFTVADPDLVVAARGDGSTTVTLDPTAGPSSDLLITVPTDASADDQAYAVRLQGGEKK